MKDQRYVFLALALLGAHWAIGGAGAGCLWELANLIAFMAGVQGELQPGCWRWHLACW
jgi:hypothetical protein